MMEQFRNNQLPITSSESRIPHEHLTRRELAIHTYMILARRSAHALFLQYEHVCAQVVTMLDWR